MTEIRAMETHYKGFRFRSRLEARWAMFYDRINLSWEFEPQPLLINGEAYLPDFLVKDEWGTFYHEVKSAHEAERIKPVKVYLAGKMGHMHNWRGYHYHKNSGESWYHEEAIMDCASFTLTGPFAASLFGHGCIGDYEFSPHWTDAHSKRIIQQCKWAINACDVFCAHISTSDAYGTLMEIGYAAALKKRISLTIEASIVDSLQRATESHNDVPGKHDLWFAEELSDDSAIVSGFQDARRYHAAVINSVTTREYRLISCLGSKTDTIMTFGDPLDLIKTGQSICFKGGVRLRHMCGKNVSEAEAIRAHRFDRR